MSRPELEVLWQPLLCQPQAPGRGWAGWGREEALGRGRLETEGRLGPGSQGDVNELRGDRGPLSLFLGPDICPIPRSWGDAGVEPQGEAWRASDWLGPHGGGSFEELAQPHALRSPPRQGLRSGGHQRRGWTQVPSLLLSPPETR